MKTEPITVSLSTCRCGCCGIPGFQVHHPSFPELRLTAASVDEAVERLAMRLETSLDVVSPASRVPVEHAIADIRIFLNRPHNPQQRRAA